MKSTIAAQMPPKLTDGRGGGIRTHDLFVPNEARYQAALRPDIIPQPRGNGLDGCFCRIAAGLQADICFLSELPWYQKPSRTRMAGGHGISHYSDL